MDGMKRHIPPLTPLMEFYNVIFLHSPYREGGVMATLWRGCND